MEIEDSKAADTPLAKLCKVRAALYPGIIEHAKGSRKSCDAEWKRQSGSNRIDRERDRRARCVVKSMNCRTEHASICPEAPLAPLYVAAERDEVYSTTQLVAGAYSCDASGCLDEMTGRLAERFWRCALVA